MSVPEAIRACKFSDKESPGARKQITIHRADNNTTTNQQRDQQKWVVVAVVIATATAAATTTTRRHNSEATAMVMDDDGRCNGNATIGKMLGKKILV